MLENYIIMLPNTVIMLPVHGHYNIILAGPVQIAQLCHLYSVENLLEHNT